MIGLEQTSEEEADEARDAKAAEDHARRFMAARIDPAIADMETLLAAEKAAHDLRGEGLALLRLQKPWRLRRRAMKRWAARVAAYEAELAEAGQRIARVTSEIARRKQAAVDQQARYARVFRALAAASRVHLARTEGERERAFEKLENDVRTLNDMRVLVVPPVEVG